MVAAVADQAAEEKMGRHPQEEEKVPPLAQQVQREEVPAGRTAELKALDFMVQAEPAASYLILVGQYRQVLLHIKRQKHQLMIEEKSAEP